MERKFEFAKDESYHIYNRGNDKRNIFLKDDDKERFIRLMFLCNSIKGIVVRDIPIGETYGFKRDETFVDIGAYCLMLNHFHLLVYEKKEGGISLFMQKLCTAYSLYFNKKHSRTGKLFEGVFKAEHADKDEYLEYLFAYIHLNPIKLIEPKWREKGVSDMVKAKQFLKNYRYSSYPDYMGENRVETAILNKSAFPEYFESHKEFEDYVDDWLNYQKDHKRDLCI
ncbi:MAG: transposase [Patescibacteria group bacterium]